VGAKKEAAANWAAQSLWLLLASPAILISWSFCLALANRTCVCVFADGCPPSPHLLLLLLQSQSQSQSNHVLVQLVDFLGRCRQPAGDQRERQQLHAASDNYSVFFRPAARCHLPAKRFFLDHGHPTAALPAPLKHQRWQCRR